MSAATSPGTGLAYGLRRVCAAWGMARSSFYAMTSGQHAEQPPAKRRGPKPAISDQALLVAMPTWRHRPGGLPQDIRVKRVLRLMRGTICSRPIAAAAVAAIPMTVRSSLMPRTSDVGHRWRSGVHGGNLHRRRALERRITRINDRLTWTRAVGRPERRLHCGAIMHEDLYMRETAGCAMRICICEKQPAEPATLSPDSCV